MGQMCQLGSCSNDATHVVIIDGEEVATCYAHPRYNDVLSCDCGDVECIGECRPSVGYGE